MSLRCGRRCLGGVGVIALGAAELGVAVQGSALWRDVTGPAAATLPDLVALAAAGAALALGVWLAAGLTFALLERSQGWPGALARPLTRLGAPALTRRWAALLVGASLSAGVAAASGSPAVAAPSAAASSAALSPELSPPAREADGGPGFRAMVTTPETRPAWMPQDASRQRFPAPGWTPTRPAAQPRGAIELVSGPARRAGGTRPQELQSPQHGLVVTRGDSLWAIVRRALGPEASDAEVARAWPRWYAENRAVIGPDADLIRPGQVLRPTTSVPTRAAARR